MKLDSPRATLAIVIVLYALFITFQLEKSRYDPSYFVTAGDLFVDPTVAPDRLRILRNSAGYDGQFYYRLAITPFTSKQTDFGIKIDAPAYRQQRIVYPLLAWLFSLGQPSIVPLSLILVNCLALCLITWLGTKYAQTADTYFDSAIEKYDNKDYKGAIELNPKYADAYINRGFARIGLGQKDSGCLDLSKAGELVYSKAYACHVCHSGCDFFSCIYLPVNS